MTKNTIAEDVEVPVSPLTPESLADMKRQDMKEAIIERFSNRVKPGRQAPARPATKPRSPYWQPVDEEC